jgi:salicylate hydroxylase
MPVGATKVFNHHGELVLEKYPDYAKEYGADWLFHHRADLRNEFLRLATTDSGTLHIQGQPAKVRWGCEVKNVNPETGDLVLSSGEKLRADLVIGKSSSDCLHISILT